jgi:hypothetical protein
MTPNRIFVPKLFACALLAALVGTGVGWAGVEIIRAVLAGVP